MEVLLVKFGSRNSTESWQKPEGHESCSGSRKEGPSLPVCNCAVFMGIPKEILNTGDYNIRFAYVNSSKSYDLGGLAPHSVRHGRLRNSLSVKFYLSTEARMIF